MSKIPPTYANFITRFPQFSDPPVAQDAVEVQLTLSASMLCVDAWGEFYSEAVLYEAAHNIAMEVQMNSSLSGGQQAASGTITSSSGAGLSVSFGGSKYDGASASDSWYDNTAFGQKFLHLRNTIIPLGMMTA